MQLQVTFTHVSSPKFEIFGHSLSEAGTISFNVDLGFNHGKSSIVSEIFSRPSIYCYAHFHCHANFSYVLSRKRDREANGFRWSPLTPEEKKASLQFRPQNFNET